MNTEAKAIDDASSQRALGAARNQDYGRDKEKLVADLKVVVADSEQLIKEVANSSAEAYAALHTRFVDKPVETRGKFDRARTAVGERTKYSTDATHAYVKENPWRSMGFAAATGVIIGFLIGRR